MRKNLYRHLMFIVLVSFLIISFSGAGKHFVAAAADKIVIKYVTSSPVHNVKKEPQYLVAVKLEKDIEEASGGVIDFRHVGGREIFGYRETLEAVRQGNIAAAWNPPSFGADIASELRANHVTKMTQQERRKNGFTDLLNEIIHKKNLHFLMNIDPTDYANSYQIYLNECISAPEDLKGKKIRATPAYVPMLKSFGIIPIQTKTGDIYTAVERGLVEGFVFPLQGVTKYKLEEVVKYYVQPGFGSMDFAFFMNFDVWKSIPDNYKKLIMNEIYKAEHYWCENDRFQKAVNDWYLNQLDSVGMKRCTLSEAAGERLQNAYYKALWDDIVAKSPNDGARLRKFVKF